ncbi:ATP-dependent DNA helicase, Rep family [Oceanithermus profundus DSM 14977]|uniref:DNA 3'-5' helicase n=1 Tax=Oceanithermus profundus (strain DSM 14977 / NBRC 100410 / VKM B-2274 / 506) TaxID=670487 RepID=E4U8J8_OCEP5|nr:UvrD-helicase domain-containing protein [Oceanithermus profundus]ADR36678.1 ATP-dependent DNA helicase, Rep family [Oceanithermus profundus DSM 14977]
MSARDLLSSLNEQQQAAVQHFLGPALVIAGAGSGKTRTVVHRVAYLLAEREVYPAEVLAVTFTNKAAGEMRERLSRMVGRAAGELWVSTFHSASLRILRRYGERIGLKPGFVVYDDDDQRVLLKEVLGSLGLEARPTYVRAVLDRIKNRMWSVDEFLAHADDWVGGLTKQQMAEVYARYQQRLAENNAVDFNDLLLRTIELFERHPEALEAVRQRARFIHVDEYQDTNPAQYRLTKLLAGDEANLMVVGDPDQSIYGFRNADIQNILGFERDYRGAVVYRLEANYRSTAAILRVANALIERNQQRLEKTLRPVKPAGEPVRLYRAPDHREEAAFVAREVARLAGERALDDFAVLYRTNAQSRVLEEAFRRLNLPARIVGGVGFYERREVKDVLAYARLAVNPADDVALRRVINVPARGVGAASVGKLAAWAQAQGVSLLEAAHRAGELLAARQAAAVAKFTDLLTTLREAAEGTGPEAFLRLVLAETGYSEMLRREGDSEPRLENLEELLRAAAEWEEEHGGSVAEFLDEIALTARAEEPNAAPEKSVTLMTLHNAKGLEFPVVFVVGVEEGLLPHRSSLGSDAEIEEERRLLYVGITRAQERLYLTLSEERETWGQRERVRPSRFLEEIPEDFLKPVGPFGDAHEPAPAPLSSAPVNRAAKGSASGFRGGEKVRHPRYGEGTVVATSGEGARQEVTVHFAEAGLKRLLVKYAGLERIE